MQMLPGNLLGACRKSHPRLSSPFPSHHLASVAIFSCGLSHVLLTQKNKQKGKKKVVIIIIIIIIADAGTGGFPVRSSGPVATPISLFGDAQTVFKLHGRSSCTKGE